MYCTDCGTANTVDSKYCKECGEKINDGYRTMMLSVSDLPVGITEENTDALTRLLDMAFWHNEAGNVAAAITASEAALALNPNSTTAHSLLGTLYEKQGDDARAIEHFEAVLARNPESAADRAKLEQLRRGVHVKAVAPPLAHQWVPPVLRTVGPKLQKVWTARADRPMTATLQRQPLAAAGIATGVILVGGLLMVRPWARAETPSPRPASLQMVAAAPPAAALSQSAFAAPPPSPALPAPVVMRPPSSPASVYSALPAAPITTADPFAGRPGTGPRVAAAYALPPVPARPKHQAEALPRLRLTALPPIREEGLAPAPVTLPPGYRPVPIVVASSAAPVPQHTVVVNGLGAGTPPADAGLSAPSSHIRISVRSAPDPGSATTASADSSALDTSGGGDSTGRAETYQQRALSLQQAADYKGARRSYTRAIQAYQGQIAAGQDVEAAQRGLAACRTGLEICKQSE